MKHSIFLIIGIMLMLSSCQKHLSREDTKKMIATKENFPIKKNYEITKSYIKDVNTVGRGVTAIIDENQSKDNVFRLFANKGLIKLTETTQRDETTQWPFGTTIRTWFIVAISITETGKPYLIQENSGSYTVNLWETDINEITGIQEMQENKTTVVNYSISNKNITPFGEIFNDCNVSASKTSNFSLYDDGWRIQQ
jgi:hypothetical protein